MPETYTRSDCRYCHSRRLTKFLSLGQHPPSDAFIDAREIPSEQRYPLEVWVCEDCFLVQLVDVVSREVLFGDYAYLASQSKALRRHYEALARSLAERFAPPPREDSESPSAAARASGGGAPLASNLDVLAVDIGCNDGVLLAGYAGTNVKPVGVEPSNVAEVSRAAGYDVEHRFFDMDCAHAIIARRGRARIVTATNVFPHVDDIGAFTDAVAALLDDDGVFVIEASYLVDVIDQTLFDTIYHEHLCYPALTPVAPFLRRHGLEVFDAERVDFGASGPAIRIFAQRVVPGGAARPIGPAVDRMLADESAWGIRSLDRYRDYGRQVERLRTELTALLASLKSQGARLGGYGAPAKGSTLLNYLNLPEGTIESIAETNVRKIGKVTPGSHIPVVSEDDFMRNPPEYALLLAWNYLQFFLDHSDYIKRGGRFVVPIPAPRIVPA